jgi:zinc/manganese transport system permease protein
MVGPPAAAQLLARRFWPGIALAAALAVAQAWLGIVLAWYSDWPTTFWIALLSAAVYLAAVAVRRRG